MIFLSSLLFSSLIFISLCLISIISITLIWRYIYIGRRDICNLISFIIPTVIGLLIFYYIITIVISAISITSNTSINLTSDLSIKNDTIKFYNDTNLNYWRNNTNPHPWRVEAKNIYS